MQNENSQSPKGAGYHGFSGSFQCCKYPKTLTIRKSSDPIAPRGGVFATNKAQLTVFIILGMLLVVTALLVAYVQVSKAEVPGLPAIIVPELAQPVYAVVTSCTEQLATQAVTRAGLQAGFVTLPREIEVSKLASIQLDKEGIVHIPSWYYGNRLRIPAVNNIQDQISRFVLERLPECVQEFENFEEKLEEYTITETASLSVNTLLTDNNAIIKLSWPLRIEKNNVVVIQKEYAALVHTPLKQLYTAAKKIMEFEQQQEWFENLTIDLYSADEEVPSDGMTVSCEQKSWRVSRIRERIQEVLSGTLPRVRVQNTQELPFTAPSKDYADSHAFALKDSGNNKPSPDDAFEYYRLNLNVGIPPLPIRVGFEYRPEWGMLLNAQPHDAGWVRSNVAKPIKYAPMGCLNQWHVVYNMFYLMRVVLKDLASGFVFQYALPVIIESNSPARAGYSLRAFETIDQDNDFCNRKGNQVYDVRVQGIEPGILQATELDNVSISYLCVNKACELGTTRADEGVYRLRTTLPESCGNPFIIAQKQGYAVVQSVASEQQVDLFMHRLAELQVQVFKHAYDPISGSIGPAETLGEHDSVTVSVRLKNPAGISWEQVINVPNQTLSILESEGVYDLSVFLRQNNIFSEAQELLGGYINENWRVVDARGRNGVELHVIEVRPLSQGKEGEQAVAKSLYEGLYQEQLLPLLTTNNIS